MLRWQLHDVMVITHDVISFYIRASPILAYHHRGFNQFIDIEKLSAIAKSAHNGNDLWKKERESSQPL